MPARHLKNEAERCVHVSTDKLICPDTRRVGFPKQAARAAAFRVQGLAARAAAFRVQGLAARVACPPLCGAPTRQLPLIGATPPSWCSTQWRRSRSSAPRAFLFVTAARCAAATAVIRLTTAEVPDGRGLSGFNILTARALGFRFMTADSGGPQSLRRFQKTQTPSSPGFRASIFRPNGVLILRGGSGRP